MEKACQSICSFCGSWSCVISLLCMILTCASNSLLFLNLTPGYQNCFLMTFIPSLVKFELITFQTGFISLRDINVHNGQGTLSSSTLKVSVRSLLGRQGSSWLPSSGTRSLSHSLLLTSSTRFPCTSQVITTVHLSAAAARRSEQCYFTVCVHECFISSIVAILLTRKVLWKKRNLEASQITNH